MSSIYRAGRNPAKSLYRLWHTLLATSNLIPDGDRVVKDFWANAERATLMFEYKPQRVCGAGSERSMVVGCAMGDHRGRPVISLGERYRWGTHPSMLLTADGEFMVRRMSPRDTSMLAMSTFLESDYVASRRAWWVSPTHAIRGGGRINVIDDGPYVTASLMRAGTWWKLEALGDEWSIIPRRKNAEFDEFLKLRERRRQLARRHMNIDPEPPRWRRNTLRIGNERAEPEQAAVQIAALLETCTPAKTIPLTRTPRPVEATQKEGV